MDSVSYLDNFAIAGVWKVGLNFEGLDEGRWGREGGQVERCLC